MMTTTLRIVLILSSIATFLLMMRKIRQSKIQIESAIFWIILAWILVLICDFFADCESIPDDDPYFSVGNTDQRTGTAYGTRGKAKKGAGKKEDRKA